MGTVYAGYDQRLDREVAVKVLRDDLTRDPSLRHRFEREARAAARVSPTRTRSRSTTPVRTTTATSSSSWSD